MNESGSLGFPTRNATNQCCNVSSFTLALWMMASGTTAYSQTSYPMLMSIKPVAAQIGQSSQHTIESRYDIADAYEVLISGEGVTASLVTSDSTVAKPVPTQLQVRLDVDGQAMPGVREVRVATPRGISTLGQLVIATNPIVTESKDNDTMAAATEITVPQTVCGTIERAEDVDVYRFAANQDQIVFFHVRSMRLQDKIHDLQQHSDPLITLRNAKGSTLAAADNTFRGDPFIGYRFPETADYYIEIRDARFQGNKYWEYAIEIDDGPFSKIAFPAAIAAHNTSTAKLFGFNIQHDAIAQLDPSKTTTGSIVDCIPRVGDRSYNPVKCIVWDGPLVNEVELANDEIRDAQPIEVPTGINGRIESSRDIDLYAFEAKQGERYSFEVVSRRIGSDLDSHLRILDEKGNQQQLNDDSRLGKRNISDSLIENWTVKSDGKYVIEIRDLHLRGAEDYVYFIRVDKAVPSFELYADTDKTQLTPTTAGIVYVRIVRKNGFDQPVQLHVDGLPKGVTATCGKIQAGDAQDGCIIFQTTTDCALSSSSIRIWGTAVNPESDGRQPQAEAVVYQEIYQPGGGRGHWPASTHTVAVGQASDIRAVKVSSNELTLMPGGTARIDVEIERANGFDKNVTLDVTLNHLSSIYGNPLPAGVSLDKANSKVLLTRDETQGYLTLKASDKAASVQSQQIGVIANVAINFVMKATYSSEPVFVTIPAAAKD